MLLHTIEFEIPQVAYFNLSCVLSTPFGVPFHLPVLFLNDYYGNTGCGVFKQGVQN